MDLALFDFDCTITRSDSFVPFLNFALSRRRMLFGRVVLAPLIIGYHLGFVPARRLRTAITFVGFQGLRSKRIHELGTKFAAERIPRLLCDHAMERISWHKERGDCVAIVSASLNVYLAQWCKQHDVELICSELEERRGLLTGRYRAGGDCSCEEKRRRVLNQYNVTDYQTVYAYGDSHEDGPMLSLADVKFFRWKRTNRTNFDTSFAPQSKTHLNAP